MVNITRDILHKLSANLIPFSFIPLETLCEASQKTDHVSPPLDRSEAFFSRPPPEKKTRVHRNEVGSTQEPAEG